MDNSLMSKFKAGDYVEYLNLPFKVTDTYVESSGQISYKVLDESDGRPFIVYESDVKAIEVKHPVSGGVKHDQGKPDLSLVDVSLVNAAARALMFGAEKYGRDNYKNGLDINRVYASLFRHLFARMSGEINDPESGLDHLDHASANMQFLNYFKDNK